MPSSASPTLPKYQHIYNALHSDIVGGTVKPGERLPSEAELVKTFGASRITVSRALRDLQQAGLVERRAGSGTYVLGARRHPRGPALSFGLLVPELGETEILEPICQGLVNAPAAREHAVVWGGVASGPEHKEAIAWDRCQQYVNRRVSGVFFTPLELTPRKDAANARITAAFEKAGIPIVLLDRPVQPYGRREDHDLVGIDNRRAGYRITEHLLRAGSQRLAFANLRNAAATVDARRAGYREALHQYGAPVETRLSLEVDPEDREGVRDFMLREHPDAIVCANDRTAALVMQTLLSLGCAIPGDVRIVGIDDVPYAGLLPVPLTTLRQPCHEIGAAAMAAMLDRVARPDLPPRDIFLHPTLIVRQSCGTAHV
jgi:GntR family transcriptional regulator, arabinose operon transcriptional repressor